MQRTFLLSAFCLISLTACAPQQIQSTLKPVNLIPYLTQTHASPQSTPEGLVPLKTPLPTSTPFTYSVQKGDTISGIALKYGVAIDELIAVNPEVSPNSMSVGTMLKIPSNPDNPSGEATPTPAPLTVQQIECYPTTDKSTWCFILVRNDFPDFMENVSAQVTLVDSEETFIASQTALLPLDILPPNMSLPLAVFFPPDIPVDAKPQVQILTAIRLLPNDYEIFACHDQQHTRRNQCRWALCANQRGSLFARRIKSRDTNLGCGGSLR